MSRVLVTGLGIVSALGLGKEENYSSLLNEQSGVKKAQFLETRYKEDLLFGEVPFSNVDLEDKLQVPQNVYSRTELLARLAVNEAIEDANLSKSDVSSFRTGFISASTVGGMSFTDELHCDINDIGETTGLVASYNLGEHCTNIINELGIKGFSTNFNTACSSSANAIMMGVKLIKSGRADRVIVGGADALAKFTVNGFNSLQILSDEWCKPFDEERKGLNLGEGAAYLILENEEFTVGKHIYAEVKGYGNANDAFHPSSISDEAVGVVNSMNMALDTSKLISDEIDYINAHGTGTVNNDNAEQKGIADIFGAKVPFSSTKPYTGHTLGAAGSIEAVVSICALENQKVIPSLNCLSPIKNHGLTPIDKLDTCSIKNVLSNSFGFGGNCSTLVFGKV